MSEGNGDNGPGGFVPLSALFAGPGARFPSEQSARWFVRKHRRRLVAADVLAIWRGRANVHPARFDIEAERIAIEDAGRYCSAGDE